MVDNSVPFEQYREIVRQVRAEERELCCRDICPHCAERRSAVFRSGTFMHPPPSGDGYCDLCQASEIRLRMKRLAEGAEFPG